MLDLPGAAALPPVLDMLIVGGGPAGTAAAFRAKELGLSALVVDYDDLMKRIRDYAKDKLILPDFGGGNQMQFPMGGELIARLAFEPLDKDAMCEEWKSFYVEYSIPAQIGVELLGLARNPAGHWDMRAYNHNTKKETVYQTRHVVIGIGRGVPRRFDIPGNSEGIAYRLNDATEYVGSPACVIGGGTSAAEAVIEISRAKITAGDPSAVYWSYRGDKLPKVSKALAEAFFDAYLGNGNIRYHPNSEPLAVVMGDDRREYLAIRTDRKAIEGRPHETQLLEFVKESCVACIGEDIPEKLLNSMGIFMASGGPSGKKRMVVNRWLETQQPNVYLVGDILSQAYLEADDFSADASSFREIKHRGNIKAALVDGVLVAEVVKQKLEGRAEIDVKLSFIEVATTSPVKAQTRVPTIAPAAVAQLDSQESAREPDQTETTGAHLVRLLPGGVEENEFPLAPNGMTTIGRINGDLRFPDDTLLSDSHASVLHSHEGYVLRDDGSATGVYLRAVEGAWTPAPTGSILRLGHQFLVIERIDGAFLCSHYDSTGVIQKRIPLDAHTIVAGRDASDLILAADDTALSRRHLAIMVKDDACFFKDLKSLNGTWIKVQSPVQLSHNDQFRVGRQTFRVMLTREIQHIDRFSGLTPAIAVAPAQPAAPTPQPAASTGNGLMVAFRNAGRSCPFSPGQTICDIADANDIAIVAECHAGICGSDPIRICRGEEHLSALTDTEKDTLQDICDLEPGVYRLACMAKPSGEVEVEIVKG
jgi:thioredoxin reductase/pSer/pThr/pTyr-binding forkhead associated (FHA) protein/ferredoxin